MFGWEEVGCLRRLRFGEGQVLSRAGAVNSILQETKELTQGRRWNINPELTALQRSVIESLLDEFSDVFAANSKRPKKTSLMEHCIETGDARPVKARYTRVSPWAEQEINTQIKQMLENGVIRPSVLR